MSGLQRAVQLVGGQTALANRLGDPVKQAHIWHWLNRMDGQVPAEYCAAIERATNGAVTRHDLRPDIFGPNDMLPDISPDNQRTAATE